MVFFTPITASAIVVAFTVAAIPWVKGNHLGRGTALAESDGIAALVLRWCRSRVAASAGQYGQG